MASIVTLGNFDGVHLGHRALIRVARDRAQAHSARPTVVAMMFDPHPVEFFFPDRAPARLTTIARRTELLRECGVDEVSVQHFDAAFADQTPAAFAQALVSDGHRAVRVVVGEDFRFGRGRAGDARVLAELGESLGFQVDVVPAVIAGESPVSSTRIRHELAEGRVIEAAALLGRRHDVDGRVIRGNQRGRTIGFRTANLEPDPVLLPADGVYAALVWWPGHSCKAVLNLGSRPTLNAGRALEVHLLDFDGDLYDQILRVSFVARVRDEQRFAGLSELTAQIARDVEMSRQILAGIDEEVST